MTVTLWLTFLSAILIRTASGSVEPRDLQSDTWVVANGG
jgi:hypothetical protein